MNTEHKEKTDVLTLQAYLSDAFDQKQILINLADTKANILLGFIGVLLALFFQFMFKEMSAVTAFYPMVFILAPLVIAGAMALAVIYPRILKKPDRETPLGLGKGDEKVFVDNIATLTIEEMAKDYYDSTIILEAVALKKFFYLRLAYLFFALGIAATIVIELSLVV